MSSYLRSQPLRPPHRYSSIFDLHFLHSWFFLFLLLFASLIAPWPLMQPRVALAAGKPPLPVPSWLHHQSPGTPPPAIPPPIVKHGKPSHSVPVPHVWPVTMRPLTLHLTTQAARALSSDKHLEVIIPAGAIDAEQAQAAGGSITLSITQILPGAGSTTGGRISFGAYQLLVQTAAGAPLTTLHLLRPLTLVYHLSADQRTLVWAGQQVYAVLRGGDASTLLPGTKPSVPAVDEPPTTTRLFDAQKGSGLSWSVQTDLTLSSSVSSSASTEAPSLPQRRGPVAPSPSTPGVTPTAAVTPTPPVASSFAPAASSITFNTQSPQALWGAPTLPQVSLSTGQLMYSYPLALPPGPGGLTPSLNLTYSSGTVDESHNIQAAAPWVGTGWNLSMGSITWSQENVTPGGNNNVESVWQFNDPNGISGQLIPPHLDTSTLVPYNPALGSLGANTIWHTSPDNHARIIEVLAQNGTYPCFRASFPNGVMEEFGCYDNDQHGTDQSFLDSSKNWDRYRWDLDLMVDRYGNQVHFSYNRIWNSKGPAVQDAVLSSLSYDDPTCHQQTACSSWNPRVTVVFDAATKVAHLLNDPCKNWNNAQYRCDDPVDLGSGSDTMPEVVNSFVLNDIKVEVNSNILRQYTLSYTQSGPQTITDPATGGPESLAGYLNLNRIVETGTGNNSPPAPAPVITLTYAVNNLHYNDLWTHATPTTNCSPDPWMPHDGQGGPCYLWSRSYQTWYLTNLDNGRGWNESFTWTEAHNNTHGVDSGNNYDPTTCNYLNAQYPQQQSDYYCSRADDKNWSHYILTQRQAVSNGVTSPWRYRYYLQTGLPSNYVGATCGFNQDNCHQGFTWGNQNDNDYADFYNGQFESFVKVQVIQPDGSYQWHFFDTLTGWGLAESSPPFSCAISPCQVAPYFTSANGLPSTALAGKEAQESDYDSSQNHPLLAEHTWTWDANCQPGGFGVSGGGPPWNPGDHYLISHLDQNNPVVVCDPRVTQEDLYTLDGVTTSLSDPRVVHKTMAYTYDGANKSGQSGWDYGNLNQTDTSGDGTDIVSTATYYPNDNVGAGIYLTDLPAYTQTQDASHKPSIPYACAQSVYQNNSAPNTPPTLPGIIQAQSYSAAGSGGCTGFNNLITVQHTYDTSGNAVTAIDGDTHQGCAQGSNHYSACAVYDSADTHITSAANALSQTTTYSYDGSGNGGYGEWLTTETDVNTQATQYQYDVLGRLTTVIRPGDRSNPTVSYTYSNTCSPGNTAPCLELDTSTLFSIGGAPSTMKQWYDGWGNLIETQTPSPTNGDTIVTYTIYDPIDHTMTKSLPYAIATPSGYIAPDIKQARSVTTYDGLGRSLGSITYDANNTIVLESSLTYTIGQGAGVGNDSNAYEQTITQNQLASNQSHQSIAYTDPLGRTIYTQAFNGLASPYTVVRTVGSSYDVLGNVTQTQTYDHTGTVLASYSAQYDALSRRTGFNDSDLGSCSENPLPPGCPKGSSDWAWKFSYDSDNNLVQQTDPRNTSVYTSYDLLDRQLCRATTATPCQNSPYASFFYDSYDNTSNPGLTFPSACVAPSGSYTSDPIGRTTDELFSGSAGSGWRCNGYDQRGQQDQSSLSVTADSTTTTQTVNLGYNDGGELTSLVYPGSDAETITTTYDVNGRLQTGYFGTPSSPDPVSFLVGQSSYTSIGQISGMGIGGSGPKGNTPTPIFSMSLGYDGIQRLQSTSATRNSQTFWGQTLTYDNLGNIYGITTTVPTTSGSTLSDVQSFCYDALNRLAWASNSGAPTGGDHCNTAPSGTTTPTYQQSFSYDDLDRMTTGPAGGMTYDPNHVHAATNLGNIPNQYAAYDAMGNMTCRNVDSGTGHTCVGSPLGATMTYDAEGRLATWTAPSGTTATDSFLYDNEGKRVLQRASASGVTDTIYFDGFTETSISGGTTTSIRYYSVGGQRIAMRQGTPGTPGTIYWNLLADNLGSETVTLDANGATQAAQLFAPYGAVRYSQGTMPTSYNFTGQRLDSQTGLLYDNFRYYDPISGRFTRSDTVQTNAKGMDPYAYVGENPETRTDPTGHDGSWWQTALMFTAIAVVVAVVVVAVVLAAPVVLVAAATAAEVAGTAVAAGEVAGAAATATAVGVAAESEAENVAATAAESASTAAETAATAADTAASDTPGGTTPETCSFTPATKVATTHGEQAIGTLHSGEKVLAYNPRTKRMEYEPILHVWMHTDNDLVDLTITSKVHAPHSAVVTQTSEVIHTNKKHPFFTEEKGFVPVAQLRLGMHLLQANGHDGVLTGWKVVPGAAVMYNLTVAQDHTFTVGAGQWVVHNIDGPGCGANQPIYRGGNTTSPKIDKVRVGYDLTPDENGVVQPGQGGVSLSTSSEWLVSKGYKPWVLSGDLPDGLQIRIDAGTHALLEPSYPMPLEEYMGLLRSSISLWEKNF